MVRAWTDDDAHALCAATQRMDEAIHGLLDPHHGYGHPDLAGYLPWMGARYSRIGADLPLSVFRGEGMVLFALARILQPQVIAECYTGTGYAACWLALGAPEATVLTVDNYVEGGAGGEGLSYAVTLRDRLYLTNCSMVYGTVSDLTAALETKNQSVDLYVSDGPHGDAPPLSERAIVIRHDDTNGQAEDRRFKIPGGSHLSVMCPTTDDRDALMAEMAKLFPVVRP